MKTLEEYQKEFKELAIDPHKPISPGLNGLIIGRINRYCGEANRRQFFKALTGKSSSKDFTVAEWYGLKRFLNSRADGPIWSKEVELKIDQVLAAAMPPQDKLI